ncbi:MAG: hypothetical protein DHS20C15_04380 [Planctomycetota bacterium]|nr:MAG: hypothetical protein DHS20C15_04380 [Planctomycetota bacterium]
MPVTIEVGERAREPFHAGESLDEAGEELFGLGGPDLRQHWCAERKHREWDQSVHETDHASLQAKRVGARCAVSGAWEEAPGSGSKEETSRYGA